MMQCDSATTTDVSENGTNAGSSHYIVPISIHDKADRSKQTDVNPVDLLILLVDIGLSAYGSLCRLWPVHRLSPPTAVPARRVLSTDTLVRGVGSQRDCQAQNQ